ncbi:MAG TPA: hypothetical protein VF221_03175 [Chloroflexota bacterium]
MNDATTLQSRATLALTAGVVTLLSIIWILGMTHLIDLPLVLVWIIPFTCIVVGAIVILWASGAFNR